MQSYRLITVATLVDRMKINGSVAREVLKNLEEEGLIKKVVGHARLVVYSEFFSYLGLSGGGWLGVLWGVFVGRCSGMSREFGV